MAFDTRLLTGVGVLAAVTEAGNFARAAEILGLTPSAVSRAVARLEARSACGSSIAIHAKSALPRKDGRFHTQVMPLLAGLDEAAAEAAGRRRSCAAGCAYRWTRGSRVSCFASKLQQFLSRYPLLSVDFSTSNYREEMMTGVDVAVRFGPPDESSLIVRKLLETRILTVAAPAYLKKHGTPRSPDDLVHHEALLFRDSADRSALSLGVPARRGDQGGQGLQSPGNG